MDNFVMIDHTGRARRIGSVDAGLAVHMDIPVGWSLLLGMRSPATGDDKLSDWVYVGGAFVSDPLPIDPSVALNAYRNKCEVSAQQFARALAKSNLITWDESLAFMKFGDMPQMMLEAISTLPAETQMDMKVKLAGIRNVRRNDEMINLMATAIGLTPTQVDELFAFAATL